MTSPTIPNKPELFCSSCLRYKARDQIVSVKRIPRGVAGQQVRYRCRTCQDAVNRRSEKPRHGG